MAAVEQVDFYGAIEEKNDEQDLMDIAITSHKELIQQPSSIMSIETQERKIIENNDMSNQCRVPVLPSEFSGQKFGVYVANLTLWNTDLKIYNRCKEIEANDLLEIRFFENKNNGICKGFAMVNFGSRQSFEKMMESFAKKALGDNNNITVLPGTKHTYEMLKSRVQQDSPHQNKQKQQQPQFQNNDQQSTSAPMPDLASVMQNIFKNPGFAAEALMNLNSQTALPPVSSMNTQQVPTSSGFAANDPIFMEFAQKKDEVIKEAELLADNNEIRQAIYKLMDFAEEIRQSDFNKDRRAKSILDNIYDTKRRLISEVEQKKHQKSYHQSRNDRNDFKRYGDYSDRNSKRNSEWNNSYRSRDEGRSSRRNDWGDENYDRSSQKSIEEDLWSEKKAHSPRDNSRRSSHPRSSRRHRSRSRSRSRSSRSSERRRR